MPPSEPNKPLMRCIGEFFGHIVRGLRQDVTRDRRIVEAEHREEKKGNVILRETHIREIEVRHDE